MSNWFLNDSLPVSVGQEYAAPASPWSQVFWGLTVMALTASAGVDGTATVSGVQATTSLGNEATSATAYIAETGLQATGSVGTVIARGNGSYAVTGLQATTSLGNEATSGTASVAEAGLQATTQLGTVTAGVSGIAEVTGVQAIVSLGDEGTSGTAVIAAPGLEATAQLNTASPSGEASTVVSGVQAIASLGDEASSGTALVSETGLEAIAVLGTASAAGEISATAPVTGAQADTSLGTAVATGQQVSSPGIGFGGQVVFAQRYEDYLQDATAVVSGLQASVSLGKVSARGEAGARARPLFLVRATLGDATAKAGARVRTTPVPALSSSLTVSRPRPIGDAVVQASGLVAHLHLGNVTATGETGAWTNDTDDDLIIVAALYLLETA